MLSIPGYTFTHQLFESSRTKVLRAIRESDKLPVVVKILNQQYPTFDQLHRFKIEFDMTNALKGSKTINVYNKEIYGNSLALILEDFDGESLDNIPNITQLGLSKKLELFVLITEALAEVHQQDIIHKDIHPGNIIWHRPSNTVKLIDFGISSIIPRETQVIVNPNNLEGSLSYISPEQTGRMNRSLDYRSDFYSLGVTFYEILTGCLPYQVNDAMKMVHCHIAKQAAPVCQLKPKIPQAVSDIVGKLMAKNAEERYQSTAGIIADLKHCISELQLSSVLLPFELGTHDIVDRFQIPQKLYGRENEISLLLDIFESTCEQSRSMLMIAGQAGIGKSALIHEIQKPITKKKGYFVSGKFGQFNRNIPYFAFIVAFQSLLRQIIKEDEKKIAQWRQALLKELYGNGQLIIDVIPELEVIIGPQPEIEELQPIEAQNRFIIVFRNFVKVFAKKEHPLVVFIDDLQWSDNASLKLLIELLNDPKINHMIIIGAYRDNEVSYNHSLTIALEEIDKKVIDVKTITLQPLSLTHITQLIQDTLQCDQEPAQSLAQLVFEKTQGNPFFVNQFLQNLYDEKLLVYDRTLQQWHWDQTRLSTLGITDNVVELISDRLHKLPQETQHLLQISACIGHQFNLRYLSIVAQQPINVVANALKIAAVEGLITSLSDFGFRSCEIQSLYEDNSNQREDIRFKFLHDRIQQAAYGLVDIEKSKAVHFSIGKLMLEKFPHEEQEDFLFDIANQLNHGIELASDDSTRISMAEINLKASKRAKSAMAYGPAMIYIKAGLALLQHDSWKTHYELTIKIYSVATELAYLNADFDETDRLSQIALFHAKSAYDKTTVYEHLIHSYFARNRVKDAVETSLRTLRELKIRLPRYPTQLHIAFSMLKTEIALLGKNFNQLSQLKEIKKPEKIALGRILDSLGINSYTSSPNLYPITVFKGMQLILKYGLYPETPIAYAAYGMILCNTPGGVERGYKFGDMALKVQQLPICKKSRARTIFIFESMIRIRRKHLRYTLDPLIYSYQQGLEVGDIQFATLSAHIYCSYSFFCGRSLPKLYKEMETYNAEFSHHKQLIIETYQNIFQQAALNLLGENDDPTLLVGSSFDESKTIKHKTGLYIIALNKLIICYLLRHYDKAVEQIKYVKKYEAGCKGLYYIPLRIFYESLTYLALYESDNLHYFGKVKLLIKVKINQQKLKKWSDQAPMNYLHKYNLVEAEMARIRGWKGRALNYYNKSISGAKRNRFTNEGALANELAARFYMDIEEMNSVAGHYLKEALYLYNKWGAKIKVQHLLDNYSTLLNDPIASSQKLDASKQFSEEIHDNDATTYSYPISSTCGSSSEINRLDLTSIIKISQTFSREIVLSKLLKSMMQILLENTGAEQGYFILNKAGVLTIEASSNINQEDIEVLLNSPITTMDSLSVNIVHYVARTKEAVVIKNSKEARQFVDCEQTPNHLSQSVLCYPLLNKGILTGILYLENKLVEGVFSSRQLEVLKLLSSKMAISIDNAQVYGKLDNKNTQILHHIEATKEMSGAKTKMEAVDITLRHLMAMENDITIQEAELYLPAEDEVNFIGYKRWSNGQALGTVMSYTLDQDQLRQIRQANTLRINANQIWVPVLQDEALKAMIKIVISNNDLNLSKETMDIMESIARSLALTLENIESQENSRLAGIGATAASIVHDLKNPIGAIMTCSELANKTSLPAKEQKKYLNIIHQEASRLSDLAQEILELGGGKLNLTLTSVNSRTFLEDINELMAPTFNKSNITFTTCSTYDGDIQLDVDRFRRVLINLANNARDAMIGAASRNGCFTLTIEKTNRGVNIIAADNGPGIPSEIQATLFEPFATFGKANGTGLGMSIVKMIVESHNGNILFDTAIGKGTTFTIFLPICDQIEQDRTALNDAHQGQVSRDQSANQQNSLKIVSDC